MPFPYALERQTQMVFNDTGDVDSYFSVRKPLTLKASSPIPQRKVQLRPLREK